MSRFWQELITGATWGALIVMATLYLTGFPWGL